MEEFVLLKELQKHPSFFLQESIIQWYYIDKSGKEQGPFWNDEMAEWWRDGALTADLRVRKKGEAACVPLAQRRTPAEFARDAPAGPTGQSSNTLSSAASAAGAGAGANAAPWLQQQQQHPHPHPMMMGQFPHMQMRMPPPVGGAPMPMPMGMRPPMPGAGGAYVPIPAPYPNGAPPMHMPMPMPGPHGVPMHPPYPAYHPHHPPPHQQFYPQPPQPPQQPVRVASTWVYANAQGKEFGPYSNEAMRKLIEQQTIGFQTKVRRSSETVFSSLGGRVKEFQEPPPLPAHHAAAATPQSRMAQMLNRIDSTQSGDADQATGAAAAHASYAVPPAYMPAPSAGGMPHHYAPPQQQQQTDYAQAAVMSQRGTVTHADALKPRQPSANVGAGMFDFEQWQEDQQSRKRKNA